MPPCSFPEGGKKKRIAHTITELFTHPLNLLRRRLRLTKQRLNHLRQQIVPMDTSGSAAAMKCSPEVGHAVTTWDSPFALPAHHVERVCEGVEGGADVAGDGHGMGARAGFVGADFGELGEEGGKVGAAATLAGLGGGGEVGGAVFDCFLFGGLASLRRKGV